MRIIDFHTHPFLTTDDSLEWYREELLLSKDEFRSFEEKLGISRVCGSIIKRGLTPAEMVRRANDDTLALMDEWKGFYFGGMQVHPDCVGLSLSEIERMHSAGVRLIGEITPYIHGWKDYSDPRFSEILDLAAEKEMILSFHRADNMEKMIADHPRLTIVKAHPGEGALLDELIDLMKRNDNLYIDISGNGYDRLGMLRRLIDRVGAERILFGSDLPINNPATALACVMSEPLTDRERELILSGNAERLLGI